MSPLKLALLLRAYAMPCPNQDLPERQAYAPAMMEAINELRARGLLRMIASAPVCHTGYATRPGAYAELLTPEGKALAERILGAAAEFYKEAAK